MQFGTRGHQVGAQSVVVEEAVGDQKQQDQQDVAGAGDRGSQQNDRRCRQR